MEWQTAQLGDLCEITASPSSDAFDGLSLEAQGTPVLSPPDIDAAGRVDARLMRRLPSVPGSLERFRLAPGDVVVVRQGTLGKLALLDGRHLGWLYGSACIRLRPNRRSVDPAYLASYLAYPPVMDWILSRSNPGTVATITSETLRSVTVAFPDLQRQRLITSALAEIDTQIEVQQQLLARLTVLRPAVFAELLEGHGPHTRSGIGAAVETQNRVGRTRRSSRLS